METVVGKLLATGMADAFRRHLREKKLSVLEQRLLIAQHLESELERVGNCLSHFAYRKMYLIDACGTGVARGLADRVHHSRHQT